MLEETYTLTNGVKIPKIGFGTWMIDSDDAAAKAVHEAIDVGYRHIDTAEAYGNEAGVGEGVRASGVPRENIFVNTKLAAEIKDHDTAVKAIDGSLEKLDLEYADMMIIHAPKPWAKYDEPERYFEGNLEAWRALEEAYKAGKLRAIGVSNFDPTDLKNLLDHAEIAPMVDQVLAHITQTPFKTIDFAQEHQILVEAYSPFGHGEMFKNKDIQKMAAKYQVSVAQLGMRYLLQLGLLPLPKTVNPDHMKANAEVDFTISDDDMTALKQMKPLTNYGKYQSFPVYSDRLS
ncbi:2,5-diketo-D-gluconic acid reductase [Lacticaseibacillus casei]|uniref:Aldo/keto reductase n=1 Tax=Lacticaseibacillus zeae TaxID=57037 RepID=A0A5R8LYC7_LACZE|nr:aldo/keto reductase [Lacticaseibacillus zeae]OLS05643.1 2,5-diketo-D-gluconic acid reductase [Lacticaseibacillus casei]QVI32480.1 aldo/keto reductase [Lacticaseibacillus zeae]TLF42344.1 aldo/keto reductase [Lacticaseibacillus zeae]